MTQITRPSKETLEAWANTKDRQGLAGLAFKMSGAREARKPRIIAWLLTEDPDDMLYRSYQIEQNALHPNPAKEN